MLEICTAKYHWTPEEWKKGALHHYGIRSRLVLFGRVFSVLLLILLGLIVLDWIFRPSSTTPPIIAMTPLALFCIYLLIPNRFNAWYIGRGMAKRYGQSFELEFHFSEDEVKSRSDLGEATTKWRIFVKIVETSDGFLLYYFKNSFTWLPYSAFESQDCIAKVREMIKKNEIPFTDRRP